MTAMRVHSEALIAHSEGSRDASDNFGQLASLLEQARVSDDCFGPLGEVMAFKYFDALEECQGLATQAKSFLDEISGKTTTAAEIYEKNDSATKDALTKIKADVDSAPGSGSRRPQQRRGRHPQELLRAALRVRQLGAERGR